MLQVWQFLGSGVPNRIHENVVRELHSAIKLPLPKSTSNFRLLGLSCWKADRLILRFESTKVSLALNLCLYPCGHFRLQRSTFIAFHDGGKSPTHTRFEKPRTASNRRWTRAFRSFFVCRHKRNTNYIKKKDSKSKHNLRQTSPDKLRLVPGWRHKRQRRSVRD